MRRWKVGLRAGLPAALALLVALVAGGIVPGRAGSATRASRASRATTLDVAVSTPVKIHGLLAGQTYVVSNLGAADAHNVVAQVRLAAGLSMQTFSSPQGKCTQVSPVGVDCKLGPVRAGVAVTLRARYRLSYVPPTTRNGVHVGAGNAAGVARVGPSYFLDRYWICGCSTVYTYPNGWTVPATDQGVSVGPTDTVHLPDGYYISPDGVLHFPDGREIRDTLTAELFIPAKG